MFKRIVKRVICATVVAAMLAPSFCVEANAEQLEVQGIVLQEDEAFGRESLENDAIEEELPEEEFELLTEETVDDAEELLEETESEEIFEDSDGDTELLSKEDGSEEDFIPVLNYKQMPGEDDFESFGEVAQDEMSLMADSLPPSYVSSNIPLTRNQNPYGTCWAHTALALAEIGEQDASVDLSELQLAYFSANTVVDPLGGLEGDSNWKADFLDTGGNVGCAGRVLASWTGAVGESVLPYSSAEKGMTVSEGLAYASDILHLQDFYKVDPVNDRNGAKALIQEYGALGVSYCAVTKTDGIKVKGIDYFYSDVYDEKYNSYYFPVAANVDHAVTIVGWDDNFSALNFKYQPEGNGAWLIRNTWESSVSIDADNHESYNTYFWMSYYDKSLSDVGYAYRCESADNYDNNYQYDGGDDASATLTGARSYANIFTAKANEDGEKLEAVAFQTPDAGFSCTIEVYTGVSDSNPSSGTLATTETGNINYAGYHTFTLSEPVELSYGENYSVVIRITNSDKKVNIENGYSIKAYDEKKGQDVLTNLSTVSIGKGQSFCSASLQSAGESWTDICDIKGLKENGYGNLCIKAFTTNSNVSKCTVAFDPNGGSVSPASKSFVIGGNYGTLPTPSRTGYDFAGWYTEESGGTKVSDTDTVPNESAYTLYAHWNAKTYTLNFNANGGSVSPSSMTVAYDASVGKLPIPTRNGYGFGGWYTSSTGGKQVTDDTVMSEELLSDPDVPSLKLYAHWTANEYTVTFDYNGADDENTETDRKIAYNTAFANLPEPTRNHYDFAGWRVGSIDGEAVKNGDIYDYAEGITLVATWTGKSVTVTFDANSGTFANSVLTKDVTQQYGAAYVLPETNPTWDLNSFIGWFDQATGGNQVDTGTVVTDSEPHTLYAHWNILKLDIPTVNPADGSELTNGDAIKLKSQYRGTTILYTLDGSEPHPEEADKDGKSTKRYSGDGIVIDNTLIKSICGSDVSGTLTLKAMVIWLQKYECGDIATFNFTLRSELNDRGEIVNENDVEELEKKLEELKKTDPDATLEDVIPEGLWIGGLTVYEDGQEKNNEFIYTGSAIKPSFRVYDGKQLLDGKKDYSVTFKNNANAGTATITVKGKGNYAGSAVKNFTILPKPLSDAELTVSEPATVIYNGKNQNPVPTITFGKKKLSTKKDYSVEYYKADDSEKTPLTPKEAGKYKVVLRAKPGSNYTDETETDFTIEESGKVLVSKLKIGKIPNQTYTGSEINVDDIISVKDGKTTLNCGEEGVTSAAECDYYVSYSNNTDIGTATVTIEGSGEKYVGKKNVTFKIVGKAMKSVKIAKKDDGTNSFISSFAYDGEEKTQEDLILTLTEKGKEPVEVNWVDGTDCVITYTGNRNAGKATMIMTGVNGYSGTVKKTFKITPYIIKAGDSDFTVEVIPSIEYQKSGAKPAVTVKFKGEALKEGTDYTLKYSNNTAVNDGTGKKRPTVTIKGKGNFKGSIACNFVITQGDLDDGSVTLTVPDKAYANKAGAWKSAVTLTDAAGKKLAAKKDYDAAVKYTYEEIPAGAVILDGSIKSKPIIDRQMGDEVGAKDIVPAGTVIKVVVKGSGQNYEADSEISCSYRIVKSDISKCKASVKSQVFTGKAVKLKKSDITLKVGNVVLGADDFEIVGYKNNINKGKASVIVRGEGDYGGTKTLTFNITTKSLKWW